jgi:hypothetical protein
MPDYKDTQQRKFRMRKLALIGFIFLISWTGGTANKVIKKVMAPTRPDGKAADMSKPVQVFILMGQSNMLGFGKVKGDADGSLENAVKNKKLYSYLSDESGKWTVRKDVRNVFPHGSGGGRARLKNNEWMTIKGGKIGPEIGIGHYLGQNMDAPVMILKSCTGNRALGWDLLPPGSKRYDFTNSKGEKFTYAGYKDVRERWPQGEEPKKTHNWYAGLQYDGDIRRAKEVLKALDKHYPGATKYEVAGFFWWQGDRDRGKEGHAQRYEKNLVALVKALRKEFNAPNAKFVCASLGQTSKENTSHKNETAILNAVLAVDGETGKYPEFKDNVASVYSHPLSKGSASNAHYSGNAETYMNVGEALGAAMVKLLNK